MGKEGNAKLEWTDADQILECYQQFLRVLERVAVSMLQLFVVAALIVSKFSANFNIWKNMDEQETVSACNSGASFAEINKLCVKVLRRKMLGTV